MYNEMKYKLALKYGFHDLQNVRDDYTMFKKGKLNPFLVLKFIEVQLLLLTPIIPHFCEYYYGKSFIPAIKSTKNHSEYSDLIVSAKWPEPSKEVDIEMSKIFTFIKY